MKSNTLLKHESLNRVGIEELNVSKSGSQNNSSSLTISVVLNQHFIT